MARRTNSSFRDIPARRVGEEGEKWISYEEQERRRQVYARSRAKKARQMEQRRLAPSLAEEMEKLRVAAARKKAARARAPKAVYTKAYLDAKGMKRRNPEFSVFHADHGIAEGQMAYIKSKLVEKAPQGFFIQQVNLPKRLGTVRNAMYGPAAGDPPVPESAVEYRPRGDRPWSDRVVHWPTRPVDYVQAIGIREGDAFKLFTVYGGPLAPMNPADPGNRDVAASKAFWSQHALSLDQWKSNPRRVYTKAYLAAKGMKRNGKVNTTIAYIFGFDISDLEGQSRVISIKKKAEKDPELQELLDKVVRYVHGTTPLSEIEASVRSRRMFPVRYGGERAVLRRLSNEADEKGWVDHLGALKKKRIAAEEKAAAAKARRADAAFRKKHGMSRAEDFVASLLGQR